MHYKGLYYSVENGLQSRHLYRGQKLHIAVHQDVRQLGPGVDVLRDEDVRQLGPGVDVLRGELVQTKTQFLEKFTKDVTHANTAKIRFRDKIDRSCMSMSHIKLNKIIEITETICNILDR